jgi:hypothetical protein
MRESVLTEVDPDRYGGWENFKRTTLAMVPYPDPVGQPVALDFDQIAT